MPLEEDVFWPVSTEVYWLNVSHYISSAYHPDARQGSSQRCAGSQKLFDLIGREKTGESQTCTDWFR